MNKPEFPITSHPSWDHGLAQRVARFLEQSPLHVVGAQVLVAMPASVAAADPLYARGGDWSMGVELALVTDGRRGWLALGWASPEWDVETEMTEFVHEMLEDVPHPMKCVVRPVWNCEDDPRQGLDLSDPASARRRIEAEFDRLFAGATPIDVDAFLQPFRACGYGLYDEATLRNEMNEAPAEAV